MADRTARHRRTQGSVEPAVAARRRLDTLDLAPPPPAAPGEHSGTGWVPGPPPRAADDDERATPRAGGARTRGPRAAGALAAVADRLPVGLRGALVAPASRAVVGLVVVVGLAVLAALATTWLSRPRAEPLPTRPRTVGAPIALTPAASHADGAGPDAVRPGTASPGTAGPGAAGRAAAAPTVVFVHVAGAVRRPGLVELPAGSRVADAVDAAGGPTRRAATVSVNLARPLVDGEQLVVRRQGEAAAAAVPAPGPGGGDAAGPGPSAGPATPVDLNAATLEQLDTLPGIGPVLAQRILDWRATNGGFTAIDELAEVTGIGEATLADLRPAVRV